MSNYVDAKPDPERIVKLAKELTSTFAEQDKLDTLFMDFYLLQNKGDTAVMKAMAKKKVDPVRSGALTRRIDRDFALTLQIPTIRWNPRSGSDSDARFADSKLEPWTAGVWKLSQVGDVWSAMNRSLHILGRAVSYISPLPRLWSNKGPYKKLLQELKDAGSEPAAVDKALHAIEAYKLKNFPIRWRREDARGWRPVLSDEYHLPEAVRVRKKKKIQIITDYGKDALPDEYMDASDDSEIELIEYDNWEWHTVIIGSGGGRDPRFAVEPWQHGMEMNPNIFMELERLDANEYGYYWKGAMFSVIEIAQAFDEFMTDLRTNVRANTIRGRDIGIDPEIRGESGPPTPVIIGAGEDWTRYNTETIGLMPAPDIHPQAFAMGSLLIGELDKAMTISALDEQARSGNSAATYSEGVQVAKSRFNSVQEAQSRASVTIAMAFLSCVKSLSKDLNPEEADTVWVVMGRDEKMKPKGSVGLAPKDVEGWISEALIEPHFGPGLLSAQSLLTAMAQQLSGPPLNLPLEYILPTFLNIENSSYWIDQINDNRLAQTYIEPVIGKLVADALTRLGMAASPAELANLAETIGQLDPVARAALMGAPPLAPPEPPPMEQPIGPGGTIAENIGRIGQMQTPPAPEGMVL